MRSTIDWSHQLLSTDEQTALRRLSVFAGGFTADAAADVCDATPCLDRLIETSLVAADGSRFRLLETVRQYAGEQLAGCDEVADYSARHAHWLARFIRRSDADTTPDHWLERLAADHDNIEAALSYAITEDPAIAARIARTATQYWVRRGYWAAGRRWIERVLAAAEEIDPPLRAELLKRSGDMARVQGDLSAARSRLEEAVTTNRALGDTQALAASLNSLGLVLHTLGDLPAARSCIEESIELNRASGDRLVLARTLNNLALLYDSLGETANTIAALEETATIYREIGSGELSVTLFNIGSMHHKTGDLVAARRCLVDAEQMFVEDANEYGRSHVLCGLAKLDLAEGDVAAARPRVVESLEIGRRLGDTEGVPETLHLLAIVAEEDGDSARARDLHTEALRLRQASGSPLGIARALDFVGALDVADGDRTAAAKRFGEARALREAAGASTAVDPHVRRAVEQANAELGAERSGRNTNANG